MGKSQNNFKSSDHARRVQRYVEGLIQACLKHIGLVFQGALVYTGLTIDPKGTNQYLAQRAEIKNGGRIQDAGRGICGPSIDIVQTSPWEFLWAVSNSYRQAKTGEEHVLAANFGDRLRITVGEFHQFPYVDDSFDASIFIESASYSDDLLKQYLAGYRMARPRGTHYIKDIYLKNIVLISEEQWALQEVDRVKTGYFTMMCETVLAVDASGFVIERVEDLTGEVAIETWRQTLLQTEDDCLAPSQLACIHDREEQKIPTPTLFGDILTRIPE